MNPTPESSKAILNALDRLQRRTPFNPEIAQLRLLHAWETGAGAFPAPEAVLNAAYAFSETGGPFTGMCIDHLAGEPGMELDLDLLRHRCGRPTLKEVPRIPLLLATSIGHLPKEDANKRQADCMVRLERTRDEDGAVRLVNLAYADEFHGRPGWREVPLTLSARDLVAPSCPRIPVMTEVFQAAYQVAKEEGFAYFAFLNSDIVVPEEGLFAIRQLLAAGYETLGFSRTDIPSIDKDAREHWVSLHISGTDLFLFSTDWWEKNAHLFGDYIMGAYWWDCVYMGILLAHSKCYYASQQRGILLHVLHQTVSTGESLQAAYNLSIRDGKDSIYFFLHCRYIEQLNAYIARHRSLPGIRANQALHADRFMEEVRARVAPANLRTPVLTPSWCEPGGALSGPCTELLRKTGWESSPLWPSARMEDPEAAKAAEARLLDLPSFWFAGKEGGRPDPMMAWWSGRRAQLRGQHHLALTRFREALGAGFRHWRLPFHALESARKLGLHRAVAACAGLLAQRPEASRDISLVLKRLGASGLPEPPHDPVLWNPQDVPLGEHDLLVAMCGWRGVETIRRAFVVGAHLFEEKELFFRTFPELQEVVLFEPIPACVDAMRKAHGGDPRVRIIPCAISGTSGEAVFHLSSNDGLSSSLLPFGTHTAHDPDVTFVEDLRVPCWTLADAKAQFGLGDPDLLFLDVQGAEYDILAAIPGDLLAKVKILFTEVSLEEIYRGGRTLPELSALLAETFKCAGYAPMQGHKGMHGNALYLNQAFMDGAAGWGPSPLLDSSGAMAGPLLSAEAAEALRAILREGLFGELFRNAGQAGRDVYLWGAGTLGRDLLAMLAGLGMEIKGVLDNSSARWGEAFHGTRILEPARVLGSEPKPYVVIGTVHHAAVARQLEEAGFTPAGDFQSVTDIY